MNNSIYIYAETAFHHEGDFDYIIQLIDEAKKSGVNGIKFQIIINLNYLTSSKHSAYNQLIAYTFTKEQWIKILDYTVKLNLDVIFMPLDIESFSLLKGINPPKYIEIHPVCFYDKSIISEIKKTNIPVIVGVGGRTEPEINSIKKELNKQLEVLMTGFQSFPSKLEDVKLKKITHYKKEYTDLSIGYADHSSYDDPFAITSNDYALFLGATIFEKHITINEGVERVDYDSAISGEKLKLIVDNLNFLNEKVLNISDNNLSQIDPAELTYRNRQKVFVANTNLKKNHILTANDVVFKMINKDDGLIDLSHIVGKTLLNSIDKDDIITKAQLK